MTGADHQHSAAVEEAASWLSQQSPAPQPVVPVLKERFGLSTVEACEACGLAKRLRSSNHRKQNAASDDESESGAGMETSAVVSRNNVTHQTHSATCEDA